MKTNSKSLGFSLVEMLVVMGMVALLMSLAAPALTSIGKSSALSVSGFQVAELVQMARQHAMAKNAMTALVIPSDPELAANGRLLSVFELPSVSASGSGTPSWRQIAKWTKLPESVVVAECLTDSPALEVPLPAITCANENVGAYRALVFMPSGKLLNSQAAIRLAEGYFPRNSSEPVLTGSRDENGGAANTYDITILPATGKTKIDRP